MAKLTFKYKLDIPFHVRPIGVFTSIVKQSNCKVTVTKNNVSVKGDKIMQLLKLAISKGDSLTVEVDGQNEDEILASLIKQLGGCMSWINIKVR